MSFMHGAPLLLGDNTVPGVQLSPELKMYIPKILQACRDWGLDFYPTVVQLLTYDEISEIAAYGGFPVRFPHWSFGMEYEELQRGYEIGAHKIYEMVINCCFSATQVLTMESGSKAIKDVKVGEHVLSRGGWRKIIFVKEQDKSKTLELVLNEFYPKTICTPNHKWKCLRFGSPVWVETKDIVAGDVVMAGGNYSDFLNKAARINWTSDKVINETAKNVRNRLQKINPPDKMTIELAEILGVITGDGSTGVQRASNIISVCIHKPLEDYKRHIANLIYKVFDKESSIHVKPKSVDNVVLCSKFAVDYLDYVGLIKGSTYKTKRVPWSIWESSNEYRAAYLRGVFDTDGHCSKYLSLSCFSDDLAQDIQLLLLEMGIRSKYFRVKNKNNDIAMLTIKGKSNIRLFKKLIGFSLEYKSKKLNDLSEIQSGVGHGQKMPGFREVIFERIDLVERQPDWMYRFRRNGKDLSSNAYWSFLTRAVESGYEEQFGDLLQIAETPLYEVEGIEDAGEESTWDIALDHDDHDFLANGLISHNTNPCYIYNLSSNTLLDHLTVVAHATGHNDFFKNNIHFSATDTNMLNKMANHGTRIRKYMARWGKERVTEFLDYVMRLETLIDGAEAWTDRVVSEKNIRDKRTYRHPRRLTVNKDRMYMEPFLNTKDFRDRENDKISKQDIADEIGVFKEPTKNILAYLRDNAPLKPWQADIVSMLYEEAIYVFPQRQTKTINEGWASMTDSVIMAEQGFVSLGQESHDCGIIEYADHKMGVLGGKYSMNPYKLGYYLLRDIRNRWDKGQFGPEWDDCTDIRIKENWDKGSNLGKEKIFEVRKYYDDFTLLHEFFTEDFCREQEYFHWKHFPNGEFKIENRDFKEIKKLLLRRHLNGGLPDIRLTEPNYRGKGEMFLQHYFDGRDIYEPYIFDVLMALRAIWGEDVYLATENESGDEKVYCCYGDKDVEIVSRKQHLNQDDDDD